MRIEGLEGVLLSALIISALIPTRGPFLAMTIMNPTTGGLPRRNAKKEVKK